MDKKPFVKPENTSSIPRKKIDKENQSFFDSLSSNPYFSAGFALVGIGALLTTLKKSSALGYTVVQKNFTVSLEVINNFLLFINYSLII